MDITIFAEVHHQDGSTKIEMIDRMKQFPNGVSAKIAGTNYGVVQRKGDKFFIATSSSERFDFENHPMASLVSK